MGVSSASEMAGAICRFIFDNRDSKFFVRVKSGFAYNRAMLEFGDGQYRRLRRELTALLSDFFTGNL